ncbi:cation efflux protein, partial [Chytriomyces sp. MP71]
VLCSVFFCVEMTAALVCGSLAILSDAFHLLTDIAAFAVSISALRMAQRTPSNDYTFGYARVEVLGACVSTLLIWAITVILVIEAYARLMTPTVIDAKVMFYTALFGVAVNIALAFTVAGGHDDDHHGHHHHHHVERVEHMDVNMRAAILHAVTDLISSLGVLLASIVLCVRPEWTWVDPLCTFFFSLCVFASTAGLMRRCVRVLMEGSPPHINVKDIKSELLDLPYVVRVQSLYLWCIS